MIVKGKVRGCVEQAQPLVIGKDTVYVHYNITKVEGNLYEYDEEQYSLNEFMNKLWQDNLNLSLAIAELGGLL